MNEFNHEAIFELLLKNSSTCSLLVDLEGNIIRFNDAYMKLIGYTEAEIKTKENTLYVSDADYKRENSFIDELLSGSKSDIKFRSSRVNKKGEVVLVEVTAILFKDHEGNPDFVLKRIEDISEKIISDEMNKNRLSLLKTILEDIPINMYFKDLESRFTMVSKNFIAFLGCTSFDEIEGKTDFDFFKEEHAREAFEDEQNMIKTGQSIIKEEKEVHKDNSITYALSTKSPLKDENGKIIGTYGISRDITDQKNLENAVHLKQLQFEAIIGNVPDQIYYKDRNSKFVFCNAPVASLAGCASEKDIIGKSDFDFHPAHLAQLYFNDEQTLMDKGEKILDHEEQIIDKKTGELHWNLSSKVPVKDENGNVIGLAGINRDITYRKKAEEKTRQMNEELEIKNRKLEETIEELSRTQNKLIFAEKMAALGSLIGGIAHEINTPLGAIKASSTNITEVVEKINVDLPWLIKNASSDEISWLFKLLTEADARDISVFSRDERQVRRDLTMLFEEHNIDNGPVIADTIVSLRLKESDETYLNFLKLPNSQRLLQILKVLFSLKRNANNIFVSVDKAAIVVRALKSYIYKNSVGAYEATDFTETINTVLILTANMIKHTKTEVITKFESVPLIFCRQDEICQVWTNIITNAIQAMGEGGTLEIGIKRIKNKSISIWFKDNGAGIPEDIKDRIFEPYFTTKTKGVGTGMGLDISRQIIENHQGKLYFESKEGVGTTFHIEIPINQEPQKKNKQLNKTLK